MNSSKDMDIEEAIKLRQKYKHFRILVIGRANAGKTTLLKRVCNTTEEPCTYDEKSKSLVCSFFAVGNPGFLAQSQDFLIDRTDCGGIGIDFLMIYLLLNE